MNVASSTFMNTEFDSIEGMWASLKTAITTASEQHVPIKMSSTLCTYPWVSTNLRRMMRRKQRANRKAKKSGQSKDWDRLKKLQSEVQRSTCSAHRRYMADVVSNDLKENSKRFWSFVKSKRQESTGVAPLINKDGNLQNDFAKKLKFSMSNSSQSTQRKTQTIFQIKVQAPFLLWTTSPSTQMEWRSYSKTSNHLKLQAQTGYQLSFLELLQKNFLPCWLIY